jgi:hypothetical protein
VTDAVAEDRQPKLPLVRLRPKHVVDIVLELEHWIECVLERSPHGQVSIRVDVKDGQVVSVRGGGESAKNR